MQAFGDGIFPIDSARRQLQGGRVLPSHQGSAIEHVSHHFRLVVAHTPTLQQIRQVGALRHKSGLTCHRVLLTIVGLADPAQRIHTGQNAPTLEQVLVDGVFGQWRDVSRMQDDQHRNVAVDFVGREIHVAHFIVEPELLNDRPRLLPALALELEHGRPLHGHGRHHTDDRFFLGDDLVDGPGNVVLELGFFRRVQERNHLFLGTALDGEPQINVVPFGIDLHALDLILARFVFFIRVWVRSQFFEHDIVIGGLLELEQQVLRVAGIRVQDRRHDTLIRADIKPDGDRLVRVDPVQDVFGAFGQRVETVLSHIHAEVAEAKTADDVVDDEHDGDHDQSRESNG